MVPAKAVYAAELAATMKREGVSRSELAKRMHTDRSTVGRVLNPTDETVTLATLRRAAEALGRVPMVVLEAERPSVVLERTRPELRRIAAKHGLTNVRVFGSVARGDDTADSDLDLVAEIPVGLNLLDVGAVIEELAAAFGRNVDLAEYAALKPHVRENIERESMPL